MRNAVRPLVVVGVVLATSLTASGARSQTWNSVRAIQDYGTARVEIRYWYRPEAAITQVFAADGLLIDDTRCEKGILTTQGAGSSSVVVRSNLSLGECLRLASDPLLAYGRMAVQWGTPSTAVPLDQWPGHKGLTYRSTQGRWSEVTLDEGSGFPVRAIDASGFTISWSYPTAGLGEPPLAAPALKSDTEQYSSIAASDAPRLFGLNAVPARIGGFQLDTIFRYDASTGAGPAFNAIWMDKSGREIQMVVDTGVGEQPQSMLGFKDLRGTVEIVLQEGTSIIQIAAPDMNVLQTAVKELRPGSLGLVPQPSP